MAIGVKATCGKHSFPLVIGFYDVLLVYWDVSFFENKNLANKRAIGLFSQSHGI